MEKFQNHTYCHFCGTKYQEIESPRYCHHCENFTYFNPAPVAVLLIPVGDGVLVVQRNIEPGKGEWAFPGGYMELNETWQECAARELKEETGIVVNPKEIKFLELVNATEDIVAIFGLGPQMGMDCIEDFVPNDETMNVKIIHEYEFLAFPIHTLMLNKFLSERASNH